VDNDPAQFTVDLLKIWKQRAEVEARDRVGKTAASGSATYGTSEIDVSLKSEIEHAGKITKYRIGIHNKSFRLIENLKVSIAEISPWPTDATYAAYNVHFPFRLWRGLGTESEGCRVNPDDTEWFDLLRWWISGSSEQQIIVGFGTQKIEGPSSYWEIKLEVTWAEGT